VSQSPLNDTNQKQEERYFRASLALNDLVRRGRSFSGYEKHCMFLNTKGERFANISAISGMDYPDDGRSLAAVDWDFDGDIDLWFGNRTAPRVRMMINRTDRRRHYLAVRLEGVKSNRDAIGARVVLDLQGSTPQKHSSLLRTVRAGDAFLSQSSKWVHFGVDDNDKIQKLSVHWPSGDSQVFDALKLDKHYTLVQGQSPKVWSPPPVKTPSPGSAPVAAHSDRARIVLAPRVPMPSSFKYDIKSPTLLNLWASWCQPCVKELSQWSTQSSRFKAKGLDVIALSVDGIGENTTTTFEDARQLLQTMGFPFQSGAADVDILSKLEILYASQFIDRHPFPVPTSILIDGEGNIAVIYFGPVDIDQLLIDVDQLEVKDELLRERAFAVSGRWHTRVPDISHVKIALDFLDKGYLDEADYYRTISEDALADTDYKKLCVNIAVQYIRNNQHDKAVALLQDALKITPKDHFIHLYLGRLLARQNRWNQASGHLKQMLKIKPDDPTGLSFVVKLVWHLVGNEKTLPPSPQLIIALAKAAESATKEKSPEVLDALAAAYAKAGQFKQAVSTAEKAITLASQKGQDQLAIKIKQHRDLYLNNQPYQMPKQSGQD